jgi:putative cell wall-binding protein
MPYDYRMAMRKVYENLYDAEVELCVIVTRDFIDKGSVFALWAHNKSELEWQNKFELVEHIYAKIPDMSLFKTINYKNHHEKKGLPLIDWEDVCIYRRV